MTTRNKLKLFLWRHVFTSIRSHLMVFIHVKFFWILTKSSVENNSGVNTLSVYRIINNVKKKLLDSTVYFFQNFEKG